MASTGPTAFEAAVRVAELIATLLTIGGILWALYFFPRNERKRQKAEVDELMVRCNDIYLRFLELQLEYTDVGATDFDTALRSDLSPAQREQQRALFAYLCSMCERVYHLCLKPDGGHVDEEWGPWRDWLEGSWVKNPNFVAYWRGGGDVNWSPEFTREINLLIADADVQARAS
ncbi:MAG TPA: hypothetical protein PLN53_06830 [Terricaulis sp.]|nr:hypothetical protein [Terricaulis sp.]